MPKLLLSIALAAMIWSACSKSDYPDKGSGDPVFWVEMADAFTAVNLTAGEGRTYLFTQVNRGRDAVLTMSGGFANADCPTTDCPASLRFEFRNESIENTVQPELIWAENQNWDFQPPHDSVYFKTVSIQWVDSTGVLLRSDLINQSSSPANTFFQILSSEPWEPNEHGIQTWKMKVSFSCRLSDSLQLNTKQVVGNGVIAVGYQ